MSNLPHPLPLPWNEPLKFPWPCPLFLKVPFPFLRPLLLYWLPLVSLFFKPVIHCILSNCLPPLPLLDPPLLLGGVTSGFQGLVLDLPLKSAEDILLNLTCMAFMSCQILPMSVVVGLTTLFSMCCPMENTLGSLATLADPGTASLILGFENSSIKKVFRSYRCHTHLWAIHFLLPSLEHPHCIPISWLSLPP